MAPSVPRHKPWFPFFKLGLFLAVFVPSMYFTLQIFNPHLDPSQDQAPAKTTRQKQVELLLKFLNKKPKK